MFYTNIYKHDHTYVCNCLYAHTFTQAHIDTCRMTYYSKRFLLDGAYNDVNDTSNVILYKNLVNRKKRI